MIDPPLLPFAALFAPAGTRDAAVRGAAFRVAAAAQRNVCGALCALLAMLCMSAPASAQHVTAADVARAQQAGYRDSFEVRVASTNQLARELTETTDPAVILDVIEMQLRTRIDGLQAASLGTLAMAGTKLAEAIGDTGRAAMLRSYSAETVFWSDEGERGLQLMLAALNMQRANVGPDGQPRAPSLLYRQYMRYASMLQTKQFDDVAVDILKQAEKLVPQVENPQAAALQAMLQHAEVKLALGDNEAALAELLKAEASAQALQYTAWVLSIANRRAEVQIDLLQLDDAERHYQNLLASAAPIKRGNTRDSAAKLAFYANSQLAGIAYLRNQPTQHYAFAKAAINIGQQFDNGATLAYAWLEVASAAASKIGGLPEAQFALNEAERLSLPPRSIRRTLAIITARAEISAAQGDATALRALSRQQNELRTRQDILRQQLQTRVAMAVFDVNNRELKVQLLERSNAMNALQARAAESRNFWQRVAIITTSALLLVVLIASAWLYRRARDLQQRNQTDTLTGALSRSAILDCARRGYSEMLHKKLPIAVCLLDFDRFKSINDEHGHEAGDIALRKTVATIKHALREGDAIGRVGGDEFLVIMVNTSDAAAGAVAERIRVAVNNSVVMHNLKRLCIQVSAGVAATGGDASCAASATALIAEADAALLAVKRDGRNAVGMASGATTSGLKNSGLMQIKTAAA